RDAAAPRADRLAERRRAQLADDPRRDLRARGDALPGRRARRPAIAGELGARRPDAAADPSRLPVRRAEAGRPAAGGPDRALSASPLPCRGSTNARLRCPWPSAGSREKKPPGREARGFVRCPPVALRPPGG